MSKSARWYFWDVGVRNALINDFRPLTLRTDVGSLWENYLIAERLKRLKYTRALSETYFWCTYDHQEIDWIEYANGTVAPYEFKWSDSKAKQPKIFAETYPEARFEVIHKDNYLDFVT